MKRIMGVLAALIIAGATLVGCGGRAEAAPTTWMCSAHGVTVVTSNYSYVHYLYQIGWYCRYVYPV